MKTDIRQVQAEGHNAALIANCPMPSAYRNTEWAQVWTDAREDAMIKFGRKLPEGVTQQMVDDAGGPFPIA